ncbi:Cyclic AMP-dependent transcription factor ATF-6 alpha [Pseudolycoriella hygida]|uniref:Cyclic AMP-dependent transcription factor ATF-6 alpha n=1 Tax=Pseudolycoriella hygida TaxID=35572 RepID=A0A9Q0MKD1_9DIPT|nr:Cyclic AMP-dependent transcription factor ATF-6 alpha [Pseudolycoriella hygida]
MEICDDDFHLNEEIDGMLNGDYDTFNFISSAIKLENDFLCDDVCIDDCRIPSVQPSDLLDVSFEPSPNFNPDDFFTDMYKSDVEIKSESSSTTHRDTPSPSISSGSSDISEFRIEMPTTIDTPPISPPEQIPTSLLANQNINILHGTLIPITNAIPSQTSTSYSGLKRIKIQPKPVAVDKDLIKTNAKTIVLSPDDYRAFVQKRKSELGTKPVVIKNLSPTTTVTNGKVSPPTQLSPASIHVLNPLIKHEMNEKILKKQQRMIKNRESACLSRKKKKEYVTSLESQITCLSKENQKLKTENNFLKNRLSQLDNVVCKCRNLTAVKTVFAPTNKKNAIFLLAFVFMFAVNFGPFGKLLSQNISNTNEDVENGAVPVSHHSRNLLWVNDSQPNQMTIAFNDSSVEDADARPRERQTLYPTCPVYINQTESIRLASELRRWIGDFPEYHNNSNALPNENFSLDSISNYFLPDTTITSILKQMKNAKNYFKNKSRRRNSKSSDNNGSVSKQGIEPFKSKIQVHTSEYKNGKYAEFFEEIGRQDDTFYVVSFTGDHLLLPALAHNKTLRPKMSLMLPSLNTNGTPSSDHVTLMQIDCEVINTSLIRIKESLIPKHLRSKPYSNVTCSDSERNTTDIPDLKLNSKELEQNVRSVENTRSLLFPQKPYFKDNSSNQLKRGDGK